MKRHGCVAGWSGVTGWARRVAVTLTIGWLVAGARVEAAITGINTPTSSFATIAFWRYPVGSAAQWDHQLGSHRQPLERKSDHAAFDNRSNHLGSGQW